jgi:hypothetical protein
MEIASRPEIFEAIMGCSFTASIWAGNPQKSKLIYDILCKASHELAFAIEGGEFRRLPTKSRTRLRGLSMTLQALADRARDERETPKPDAWWRRFF